MSTLNLAQPDVIFLFLILIALFIVAYKVLKLIIQTGLVAVLSGVFYAVLSYTGYAPPLSIQNILFFVVTGAFLYLFYSALFRVMGIVYKTVKKPISWIKNYQEKREQKKKEKGTEEKSDQEAKEKKIILSEVNKDEDE